MKVRIGTRGSDLALWQANFVARRLERSGCAVEIVVLRTRGDRIDDVPLHHIEGKAFFTAEIEAALLAGEVDVAVHSHKDLPVEGPPGLALVAIPERAAAGERLLMSPAAHDPAAPFLPLARGAVVGTSAPRRTEQLTTLRPDLEVRALRGNVPTRVRRLAKGRYDAIVLAAAGLDRLGLDIGDLVDHAVSAELLVPAPAQGALALQVRADDTARTALLRELFHDERVAACVAAERGLLVATGGGCNLPLGCSVTPSGSGWQATAFLGADHPAPGALARWARATGDSPAAAVDAVEELLRAGTATSFGPLRGRRIAIVGAAEEDTGVGARLAALGAAVQHEAVLAFEPLGALPTPLGLAAGDGLAVTSKEAARRITGIAVPRGVVVGAVGEATAEVLRRANIDVSVVGRGGARELANAMPIEPGRRVLFPCAQNARLDLEEGFGLAGVAVERLPLYRTVPREDAGHARDVDARLYMSPSAFEACLGFERELGADAPVRLGLGRTTVTAIARQGYEVTALEDYS